MSKIIDYLLNGELDQKLSLLTTDGKRLLTIVCAESDKLTATFSDEQKVLFKSYCEAEISYRLDLLNHYFTEGFKAGLLMGLEIKE